MAAPSSSSSSKPQRAAASRPARKFTLEQANRALPLVKRSVADIVRAHAQAADCREKLERTMSAKETQSIQQDLDYAINRLQDLVDELSDVGVELKDYEAGLVDFVGRHDGRDVDLCWKLGEEQITHWHEISAGFAGRQPVSTLREREPK
jgi:hypothetical protein